MRKKTFVVAGIVLLVIVSFLIWRLVLDPGKPGPPTLSRQATFITDQKNVRNNGYIDFLQAINDIRRGDISPESNGCIDLSRALGPDPDNFKEFGVRWRLMTDQPEPGGPFFKPFQWTEATDEAIGRIWSDNEFPELIDWFRKNEKPADLFSTAVQKGRFYYPLCRENEDDPVLGVFLALMPQSREAARFLGSRANNHIANDRIDEGITDLLTMRGLGSLVSQNGLMVEHLVGVAIHGMASDGERRLIEKQIGPEAFQQSSIDAVKDSYDGISTSSWCHNDVGDSIAGKLCRVHLHTAHGSSSFLVVAGLRAERVAAENA